MALLSAVTTACLVLALPPVEVDDTTSMCGPVSIYVALESLGIRASLSALQRQCGWQPAKGVSFKTVVSVVESHAQVESRLVNLSYSQLREFVRGGGVAILPIRTVAESDEFDHVICVVNAGDTMESVEYPEGRRVWTENALRKHWGGDALLIRCAKSRAVWATALLIVLLGVVVVCGSRLWSR